MERDFGDQLPEPVEAMIVRLKKDKPRWGARKIRELLVRKLAGDVRIPAKSTVHAVLDRHGLTAGVIVPAPVLILQSALAVALQNRLGPR